MIKLVIISQLQPAATFSFEQPSILIGSDPGCHMTIPGESLKERHVQILERVNEKEKYQIFNLANDPFVTLNGLPFGKKAIQDNDLIQIGNTTIRFLIDGKIEKEVVSVLTPPKPEPLIAEKKEEPAVSLRDVEDLFRQVEALSIPISSPQKDPLTHNEGNSSKPAPEASLKNEADEVPVEKPKESFPSIPKLSLKDYYLSEYDDDNEVLQQTNKEATNKNSVRESDSFKFLIKIFGLFISACALVITIFYFWISSESDEDEIRSAKSISDVAMALTYAQINHIRPQNQNWSDPEFIRNNLFAVLASEFNSFAEFDSHGQFAKGRYMLRIYTSGDLSQFLVIAQPDPSLLHWLMPKASIVIDSRAMELRKITDLKTLNRLLVNANTLDSSRQEISNLIQQGTLIPLNKLTNKKENQGFSPPKALGMIRPNAQNYIYNAPRYYPLGESLIRKALDLADRPHASSQEVGVVFQEIQSLSKFSDFVFYSSDGLQNAIEAQKALTAIAPKEKFLIAYVQLNARGKMSGSHLLVDDKPTDEVAAIDPIHEQINWAQYENELKRGLPFYEHKSNVDNTNPVFQQLVVIAAARQKNLKPLRDELVRLLKAETLAPQMDFDIQFSKLQKKYVEIDEEENAKLVQKIAHIVRHYPHTMVSDMLSFIKELGLDLSFQNYLSILQTQSSFSEITEDQIENHFFLIDSAVNWQDLEQQAFLLSEILQLANMPDVDKLTSLQKNARSKVLRKLNQFLLSSNQSFPIVRFDHENEGVLKSILKAAWISDPDTSEFYLSEFKLRNRETIN